MLVGTKCAGVPHVSRLAPAVASVLFREQPGLDRADVPTEIRWSPKFLLEVQGSYWNQLVSKGS